MTKKQVNTSVNTKTKKTTKKITKSPKQPKTVLKGVESPPQAEKEDIKPTETQKPEETKEITSYNTTEGKILQDIELPLSISPVQGQKSNYTREKALSILINIAINGKETIEQICRQHETSDKTVYLWCLYSEPFTEAYYRAMELRQDSKIRAIEGLESDMDAYIDNPENDVREKGIRIQRYRTKTLTRFWEASRLNKRYQEKTQQDSTITVDHANQRAEAWVQAQEWREHQKDTPPPVTEEIEYKDVKDTTASPTSNDTQSSTNGTECPKQTANDT